jgi:predicted GH43/DUF377 family glycosyl hydrolase
MSQHKYGYDQLLQRYAENPILTANDWPYSVNSVFNPAAVMLQDGTTLLLCRVEDMRGHSHLCAARSKNGVDSWNIDSQPTMLPDEKNYPEEVWGLEDPRITYVPELNRYAILYTSYSRGGPGVSLAMTGDFKTFERFGAILPPDDKDAALLPHRINGQWALIHRPVGMIGAHMWISFSNDLIHWGQHKIMLEARRGAWWDANKIGLCCPPIETPEGWLTIYHGVRQPCSGCLYRLGLAMFDLDHPDVCIWRSDEWIFGPEEPYERFGDVGNVVFPCGYVVEPYGDTIRVYYGAADTSVALATGKISEMIDYLKKHGRAYIQRPVRSDASESVMPFDTDHK